MVDIDMTKYKHAYVQYYNEVIVGNVDKIGSLDESRLVEARLTSGQEELRVWKDNSDEFVTNLIPFQNADQTIEHISPLLDKIRGDYQQIVFSDIIEFDKDGQAQVKTTVFKELR